MAIVLEKSKVRIVATLSDTSHFLQPHDQKLNRVLERDLEDYSDILTKVKSINLSSVRTKLILAIVGLKHVSPTDIIESFEKCGRRLMGFRFITLCT